MHAETHICIKIVRELLDYRMLESYPTGSHLHWTHWWHHWNLGPTRPHSHSLDNRYCQLLSIDIHGVLEAAMFVYLNWAASCLCDAIHLFLNCANLNLFQQQKLYVTPFGNKYTFLLFHYCFHFQLSQMISNCYWYKIITWLCSTSISSCWRHTRHSAYYGDSKKSSPC